MHVNTPTHTCRVKVPPPPGETISFGHFLQENVGVEAQVEGSGVTQSPSEFVEHFFGEKSDSAFQ